ncbi:MAG: ATP-binding protein, partial [Candidatus Poseidoniaceae archaeon]
MPIARQTDPAGENNSHHSTKYRIEEAIGDLIDNSIDAKARNISVYIYDQDYTEAGSPKVQGVNEMNYPS